jgi:hypothetical protein
LPLFLTWVLQGTIERRRQERSASKAHSLPIANENRGVQALLLR